MTEQITKQARCKCCAHLASDFPRLTDFYAIHFVPAAWQLEYITIDFKETGRVLYLNGRCDQCGGLMRYGAAIPIRLTGFPLFADIYEKLARFRPLDSQDAGRYYGPCRLRSQWYLEQDQLPDQVRREQFVALFREEDQPEARLWVEQRERGHD